MARHFQLADTAVLWNIVSILFFLGLGSFVALLYTSTRSAPVSIILTGLFVVLFLGAEVLFLVATSSFSKEASRRIMQMP